MSFGVQSFIFVFTCIFPIIYTRNKYNFFRPDGILPFGVLLYGMANPIAYLLGMQTGYSIDSMKDFLFMNTLFLITFYIGFYGVMNFEDFDVKIDTKNLIKDEKFERAIILLLIVSFGLYYYTLYKVYGGITGYFNLSRVEKMKSLYDGADKFGVVIYFIQYSLTFLTILSLARYYIFNEKKYKKQLYLYIALSTLVVLFFLLQGERSMNIELIFALCLGFLYFGKIKMRYFYLSFIPLFPFLILFGRLRVLIGEPPLKIYTFIKKGFEWSWFDPSQTEFAAPMIAFNIIRKDFNYINYLYGESFYRSFEILIPRIFLRDRYSGLLEWFVEQYYPRIYSSGGGLGFSFMAEFFINFGVYGSLLGVVIGILLGLAWKKCFVQSPSILGFTFYGKMMILLFIFSRIDFASFIKKMYIGWALPVLIVIIIYYILKFINKK